MVGCVGDGGVKEHRREYCSSVGACAGSLARMQVRWRLCWFYINMITSLCTVGLGKIFDEVRCFACQHDFTVLVDFSYSIDPFFHSRKLGDLIPGISAVVLYTY